MVYTDAQLINGIERAEDVGQMHTDAFEKLAEMYAVKKPTDRKDMMNDSVTLMQSYCAEEFKSECEDYVKGVTETQFDITAMGPKTELSYPKDDTFSPELQKSLAKVNSIVSSVKGSDDIDDAVSELAAVKKEVEEMKDVTEEEKLAVLISISVASESSKLWHSVYTDPKHILHGLHTPAYFSGNNGERRLQEEEEEEEEEEESEEIDFTSVINADIDAAIEAATAAIETFDPVNITISAVTAAVPASISALMAVFFGEEDEDTSGEDADENEETEDGDAGR
jgi:hypothetical protein